MATIKNCNEACSNASSRHSISPVSSRKILTDFHHKMMSHAEHTASCRCKCTRDSVSLILRVVSSAHLELTGRESNSQPLTHF